MIWRKRMALQHFIQCRKACHSRNMTKLEERLILAFLILSPILTLVLIPEYYPTPPVRAILIPVVVLALGTVFSFRLVRFRPKRISSWLLFLLYAGVLIGIIVANLVMPD